MPRLAVRLPVAGSVARNSVELGGQAGEPLGRDLGADADLFDPVGADLRVFGRLDEPGLDLVLVADPDGRAGPLVDSLVLCGLGLHGGGSLR